MGDDRSHAVKSTRRRFVIGTLILAAIVTTIAVPLIVSGDLRLNLAHRLHLAPGWDAVQVADGDDGITLVVVPLAPLPGMGPDAFRYRAQFLAAPSADGTVLTDIDTERTLTISLQDFDLISADANGEHVLFRGTGLDRAPAAVLVETATLSATTLPAEATRPDIPGDWDTPVWEKTTGRCDRYSVSGLYLACFNRPEAASYLAGDWQIDVQVFGDFRRSAEVYRGTGLLPFVGWAQGDTQLYLQNDKGIWRIPIRDDMFPAT